MTDSVINDAKLFGKKVKPDLLSILRKQGIDSQLDEWFRARSESLEEKAWLKYPYDKEKQREMILQGAKLMFGQECIIKKQVPFMKQVNLAKGYQREGRKVSKKIAFTKRVTKVKKGVISRHNTRLVFYSPDNNSSLHDSHVCHGSMWLPDYTSHSEKKINTTDAACHSDDLFAVSENIQIDPKGYTNWRVNGGLEKAIEVHDTHFENLIKKRHLRRYKSSDIRSYGGTHVAEALLSLGPVTISESYWRQLQKILKRTHIFDELGMFKYQSYSYEKLVESAHTVSMEEHRRDKAMIMLNIRRKRNEQRRAVKEALRKHKSNEYSHDVLSQLENSVDTWISGAQVSIGTIEANWASEARVDFDTHEISAKRRAGVARFWLLEQLNILKGMTSLWKFVLSSKQLKSITDGSSDVERGAVIQTQRQMNSLSIQSKEMYERWEKVATSLESVLSSATDDMDSGIFRNDIQHAICNSLPESHKIENMFVFWKPKTVEAKRQMECFCSLLRKDLVLILKLINLLDGWQSYMPKSLNRECDGQLYLL